MPCAAPGSPRARDQSRPTGSSSSTSAMAAWPGRTACSSTTRAIASTRRRSTIAARLAFCQLVLVAHPAASRRHQQGTADAPLLRDRVQQAQSRHHRRRHAGQRIVGDARRQRHVDQHQHRRRRPQRLRRARRRPELPAHRLAAGPARGRASRRRTRSTSPGSPTTCSCFYGNEAVPFIGNAITDPVQPGWLWTGARARVPVDELRPESRVPAGRRARPRATSGSATATSTRTAPTSRSIDLCDDFQPLGDPGPNGRLTRPRIRATAPAVTSRWSSAGRTTRPRSGRRRAPGRVFVSKNADATNPATVQFVRLDSLGGQRSAALPVGDLRRPERLESRVDDLQRLQREDARRRRAMSSRSATCRRGRHPGLGDLYHPRRHTRTTATATFPRPRSSSRTAARFTSATTSASCRSRRTRPLAPDGGRPAERDRGRSGARAGAGRAVRRHARTGSVAVQGALKNPRPRVRGPFHLRTRDTRPRMWAEGSGDGSQSATGRGFFR